VVLKVGGKRESVDDFPAAMRSLRGPEHVEKLDYLEWNASAAIGS